MSRALESSDKTDMSPSAVARPVASTFARSLSVVAVIWSIHREASWASNVVRACESGRPPAAREPAIQASDQSRCSTAPIACAIVVPNPFCWSQASAISGSAPSGWIELNAVTRAARPAVLASAVARAGPNTETSWRSSCQPAHCWLLGQHHRPWQIRHGQRSGRFRRPGPRSGARTGTA